MEVQAIQASLAGANNSIDHIDLIISTAKAIWVCKWQHTNSYGSIKSTLEGKEDESTTQ